jgi:hypothetical protein
LNRCLLINGRRERAAQRSRIQTVVLTIVAPIAVVSILGCEKPSPPEVTAPSAEAPAPAPAQVPSNAVGEIVAVGGYQIGVAGGRLLEDGGALAVQVYVKKAGGTDSSTRNYLDLKVQDGSGAVVSASTVGVIGEGLPYLDTSNLADGQATGGWIDFTTNAATDQLTLIAVVTGAQGVIEGRISLAGVTAASATSPAAEAFASGLAAAEQAEDARTVTMAEYKDVKNGMSLSTVQQIVGFEGEESSSSGDYEMWSWANSDGSNMLVTFRRNKVQSKAQAGLD